MVAVADTRRSVEQGRVPDGMLAAFHRIAAGYVGMVLSLPYTTVSSPTRALPYTQAGVKPAPWECHCCRPLSWVDVGAACYALLSSPVGRRPGRAS